MTDAITKIVFAVANEMQAIVSQRIHNKGLATDGTALGKYSMGYQGIRERQGRQIDFKDYQLTGRYKNAYTTGINNKGNVVLGFDEPYTVGEYSLISIIEDKNKDHGGVRKLSEAEIKHAQESMAKLLTQWRNNYFRS